MANAQRVTTEAQTKAQQLAEAERDLRWALAAKEAEMEVRLKEKEVDEAKSNIKSFNAAVYDIQATYPDLDLSPFYIIISSLADDPVMWTTGMSFVDVCSNSYVTVERLGDAKLDELGR